MSDEQLFQELIAVFIAERERLREERDKFWDLWLHEKFLRIKAAKETRLADA